MTPSFTEDIAKAIQFFNFDKTRPYKIARAIESRFGAFNRAWAVAEDWVDSITLTAESLKDRRS